MQNRHYHSAKLNSTKKSREPTCDLLYKLNILVKERKGEVRTKFTFRNMNGPCEIITFGDVSKSTKGIAQIGIITKREEKIDIRMVLT